MRGLGLEYTAERENSSDVSSDVIDSFMPSTSKVFIFCTIVDGYNNYGCVLWFR